MGLADLPTWADAAPAVAAAAGVLLVPGLVLGLALGLRGLVLWACAPLLSVGLVAVSAVVAPVLGLPWSPWAPGLLTAAAVLLVALGQALGHALGHALGRAAAARWGRAVPAPREVRRERAPWAAPLAVAAGAVLAGAGLVAGIPSPGAVSQSYDGVFHLNAVRYVLDTGSASSLDVGRVTFASGFYPAAWHGAVGLVVQLSGAGVPVAANAVGLAVVALVWPGGSALLARAVLPGRPAAPVVAALLASAFPVFPLLLLNWGVVYGSFLAVALLPAALALVLALSDSAPGAPAQPRTLLLVVLGLSLPGIALAHPSGVAALGVLGAPPVLAGAAALAVRTWRRPRGARAVLVTTGVLVAGGGALVAVLLQSSLLAAVSAYEWPPRASAPQAVGEALTGAPPGGAPGAWWGSLLAVTGAVLLVRRRRRRSLVVAAVAAAAIFVVAQSTTTSVLTGAWYNDAYRIAPMVTVVAVPLATTAVVAGADRVAATLPRRLPRLGLRGSAAARRGVALVLAGAAAVAAAVLPGSGTPAAQRMLDVAYESFRPGAPLLDRDEVAFLDEVSEQVPQGAVVANDPFDGSALLYALTGDVPLFTHMSGSWSPEELLVAGGVDRVGSDPAVCEAARDLGVEYVLALGEPRVATHVARSRQFGGVAAADASDALDLVAASGGARLLRITGCAGRADLSAP